MAPTEPENHEPTCTKYVVPDDTGSDTKLFDPSPSSSSLAMFTNEETEVPVKTPNTVSNELPLVLTVKVPLEDAKNEYHFVEAVEPLVIGSPVSRVAVVLVSFVEPLVPESTRADEK